MNAEVIDTVFHVRLVGRSGIVVGSSYGATGCKMMDELWTTVHEKQLPTSGINYSVYLPNNLMSTGVELTAARDDLGGLERREVTLPRYLAPFTSARTPNFRELGRCKTRVVELGERATSTGLEIYGHWDPDPTKLETTILIGLEPGHD